MRTPPPSKPTSQHLPAKCNLFPFFFGLTSAFSAQFSSTRPSTTFRCFRVPTTKTFCSKGVVSRMPGHPMRLVLLLAAAFLSVAIAKNSNGSATIHRRQTDIMSVTQEMGSDDVKETAEQSTNSLNMVQVHPPPKGKVHASLQFRSVTNALPSSVITIQSCLHPTPALQIRSKATVLMLPVSFISSTVHAAY